MAEKNGVISIGGDVNPGMLADATERAVGAGSIFKTADAQDLPFEDQGFNAIICQQGLQFFPNKAAALSECLRVLKPAG